MTSSSSGKTDRYRSLLALSLILFVLAAVLRLFILDHQGLWTDEVFSLAMATGHSLEHPAALAVPSLGDYVEAPTPLPSTAYLGYTQHENPPVGPDRVLRAVRLSDTSPPLYYLLLWAWTRVAGTSDAALRLFSVLWALACFPFVWLLAKAIGGRSAILPALVLFSVSPLSIYFSTEGRMYSMLWFLALSFAWLSLKLNQRGPHPTLLVLWILVGAAGLLTHYFYIFVLAACGLWLLIYPGRLGRRPLLAGAVAIGLLAAPWYVIVPESLSSWRVTKGWLHIPSGDRLTGALRLPWVLVSPSGVWGKATMAAYATVDRLALGTFALLAILLVFKVRRRIVSERRLLIWCWLAAACVGPAAFDWSNDTFAVLEPRYAVAGMPAALLLIALGLGRISSRWRIAFMIVIVAAWLSGIRTVLMSPIRNWQPTKQLGAMLDTQASGSAVVLVHSIPSGIAGVARYVARPIEIYSWVSQLKQRRVPEDLERLALDHSRLILVKIHTLREPIPEEIWLRKHASLIEELAVSYTTVLIFATGKSASGKDPSRI